MNRLTRSVLRTRAQFGTLVALVAIALLPSTAAAAPTQPTNFHANAVGQTQVALAWKLTTGASSYVLYRNNVQIAVIEGSKANYFDTGLANNTTYVYGLAARDSTGDSTQAPLITKTVTTVTNITSCSTTPLGSGHYALSADLTNPQPNLKPCLTFASGSNVSLDCRYHTITNAPSAYNPLITVQDVTGFFIAKCNLNRVPVNNYADLFRVLTSTDGTIEDVHFSATTQAKAYVQHADRLVWNNDSFSNVVYESGFTNDNYIGHSTFTNPSATAQAGAPILLNDANHDIIADNTIDGGATGPDSSIGTDDGIGVAEASNLTVTRNHISHVWDVGIEGVNDVTNSAISYNVISYASFGGIGEWYGIQFNGNKVWYNKIDHSGSAFQFFVATAPPFGGTNSFSSNVFGGNTFTDPSDPSKPSASFDFASTDLPITPSNNSFLGNNFGKTSLPPVVQPTSLISSAINNVCTLPSPDLPCT